VQQVDPWWQLVQRRHRRSYFVEMVGH
jgi:hypothetical protein